MCTATAKLRGARPLGGLSYYPYMYCQIAPRSTIDPADTRHPIHVYYAVIYVLERVDTEGFKRKVESDRE